MSLEQPSYDEEPPKPTLTVERLTQWVEQAAAESRDRHGCPDCTGRAEDIAQSLLEITRGHPAFLQENRHRQGVFNTLVQVILDHLYATITENDVPDVQMRRHMLYAWAGRIANQMAQ